MFTQSSKPLLSTTPSESAARNFAGTVSRFFASSEYSKVPRKATGRGHVVRSRSRGGEVGGASPPRLAGVLLPHLSPQSNTICTLFPTLVHTMTGFGAFSYGMQGLRAVGGSEARGA